MYYCVVRVGGDVCGWERVLWRVGLASGVYIIILYERVPHSPPRCRGRCSGGGGLAWPRSRSRGPTCRRRTSVFTDGGGPPKRQSGSSTTAGPRRRRADALGKVTLAAAARMFCTATPALSVARIA